MTQRELDEKLIEICKSKEIKLDELKMIIIIGANIFYRDMPITSCCRVKNLEHIKILVKSGVDINDVLYISAREGYLDGVKYAIENGADVHDGDDGALRISSDQGDLDVVKYLVENGANIHACEEDALMLACHHGHLDVLKFLVNNGADIHVNDDELLSWASDNRHKDVAEYIKDILKKENKNDSRRVRF